MSHAPLTIEAIAANYASADDTLRCRECWDIGFGCHRRPAGGPVDVPTCPSGECQDIPSGGIHRRDDYVECEHLAALMTNPA